VCGVWCVVCGVRVTVRLREHAYQTRRIGGPAGNDFSHPGHLLALNGAQLETQTLTGRLGQSNL
jgi:hypothetical protein